MMNSLDVQVIGLTWETMDAFSFQTLKPSHLMTLKGLYSNAYLAEISDEETQTLLSALADGFPEVFGWWLGGSDFYEV